MRPILSGSLSFGLINIPVRVFSASNEHALSFDMLHKKDNSPIRYAKICKEEEKEVPYKDIVKGYQYQKGEYVIITDDDFKNASAQKTNAIEIMDFVPESDIDSIYFEKPYYLEPDKGASKSYALLREALRISRKVGIVKFIFKNREHLGAVKPFSDAIVLMQLRYADEIRNIDELKLPEGKQVNKKEIDMALKLIEQLTGEFRPEAYHDNYHKILEEIIKKKLKGIPITKKKTAEPKPSKVHDIMSLLKASLEEHPRPVTKRKTRKKVVHGT